MAGDVAQIVVVQGAPPHACVLFVAEHLAAHLLRGLPSLTDRVRQLDQGKGKNRIEAQIKAKVGCSMSRVCLEWGVENPLIACAQSAFRFGRFLLCIMGKQGI